MPCCSRCAALERPTTGRLLLLGLPLGYGALTRSDGLLFSVLLAGAIVWCVTRTAGGRDWRRAAQLLAAGLVASIVLVGGWMVRNEVQMHTFVPVAVNTWDVIAGANCHTTYYGDRLGAWDEGCLQLQQADRAGRRGEIAVNQYVRDRGVDYLRGHTGRLAVVVPARLGLTFGVFDPWHELAVESAYEGRDETVSKVGFVMYVVLALLAVAGFVRLGAGSARRVLIVPFAAVVVSTVVGYGNQRFRMPLEPVIVVLAAFALTARSLGRSGRQPSASVGSMR